MVKVFTSRVAYQGKDRIDATVKSGDGLGDVLAPTWSLVAGHKLYEAQQENNEEEIQRWSYSQFSDKSVEALNGEQYTEGYLQLLRQRYSKDPQPFVDILSQPRATITCYCAPGEFCHRHLAVNALEKIAEKRGIPFERGGELNPYTGKPWQPKDDQTVQRVAIGVLPMTNEADGTPLGFATAALVTRGTERSVLELAHFGKDGERSADRYADMVCDRLEQEWRPTEGAWKEMKDTVQWLGTQAKDNLVPVRWQKLTLEQNQAWEANTFSLKHKPEEIKIDPERQELSFGVAPIIAPDGMTPLGFGAFAMVSQAEPGKHALLEVAHFANNGRQRADEYVAGLEQTTQQRTFPLIGNSANIGKTVEWLTQQSKHNGLPGDWNPLTEDQSQAIAGGSGALTHSFGEVKTMSSDVGRGFGDREL